MTIVRPEILDTITLDSGCHDNPEEGMCLLEAVAWIAGEPFSDQPVCVSPVLATFGRSWNDSLGDEDRNRLLKPYIARLVGTNTGPADDNRRAWMCIDWLVREYTPAWLRLAGLVDHADSLAGLPEFGAGMDVPSIRPAIEAARRDAAAAWVAAWAAARDAAWDAAWVAARDAARDAAGDAARVAAWDAARAAARVAAWDAAAAAARVAAWDAAAAAARVAARAAGDAARDSLQPTVVDLQRSACNLLDRMIAVGQPA